MQNSLENSCETGTNILVLEVSTLPEDPDGATVYARPDITDELNELQKGCTFSLLLFLKNSDFHL